MRGVKKKKGRGVSECDEAAASPGRHCVKGGWVGRRGRRKQRS